MRSLPQRFTAAECQGVLSIGLPGECPYWVPLAPRFQVPNTRWLAKSPVSVKCLFRKKTICGALSQIDFDLQGWKKKKKKATIVKWNARRFVSWAGSLAWLGFPRCAHLASSHSASFCPHSPLNIDKGLMAQIGLLWSLTTLLAANVLWCLSWDNASRRRLCVCVGRSRILISLVAPIHLGYFIF